MIYTTWWFVINSWIKTQQLDWSSHSSKHLPWPKPYMLQLLKRELCSGLQWTNTWYLPGNSMPHSGANSNFGDTICIKNQNSPLPPPPTTTTKQLKGEGALIEGNKQGAFLNSLTITNLQTKWLTEANASETRDERPGAIISKLFNPHSQTPWSQPQERVPCTDEWG